LALQPGKPQRPVHRHHTLAARQPLPHRGDDLAVGPLTALRLDGWAFQSLGRVLGWLCPTPRGRHTMHISTDEQRRRLGLVLSQRPPGMSKPGMG
jgi:hypothetical protein